MPAQASQEPVIRPGSHPQTNRVVFELVRGEGLAGRRILDVGAGRGHMVQKLARALRDEGLDPALHLSACDLYPEGYEFDAVPCAEVSADERLPFEDASFDVLYSIEVIEHLRHPYGFLEEVWRVLRPGGLAVITAPNVLNISARFRQLWTGFPDLFGPLALDPRFGGTLAGHIMPLSVYYLHYGLRRAGFESPTFLVDRRRKISQVLYFLLWPAIAWGRRRLHAQVRASDQEKAYQLERENAEALRMMNSRDVLCARSAILSVRKSTSEGR